MTISERLAKLERDNRRCRRLLVALALLLGVTVYWTMGHQSQMANAAAQAGKNLSCDELTVRNIKIVNDKGVHIGSLGQEKGEQGCGLVLANPGKSHILMTTGPLFAGDPQIAVANLKEESTAYLGSRVFSFGIGAGENTGYRLSMGVNKQLGGGYITVSNPLNKPVVLIQSDAANGGRISTYSATGQLK